MSHHTFDQLLVLVVAFAFVIYFLSKYETFFIVGGLITVSIFIYVKVQKHKDEKENKGEAQKPESFYDTMKRNAKSND